MSDNKRRKINVARIASWGIAALILIAIVLIIVKIKIWDKGQVLDPTIDENPDFDFETIDSLTLFPPSKVNENDDGVLTIVMFGNDSYATDESGHSVISDTIASELNATVYNLCLPKSSQAAYTPDLFYDFSAMDAYSLYGLLTAAKDGDFTNQRNLIPNVADAVEDYYAAKVEEMATIDFDTVDIFMFCYDGHDFYNNIQSYNGENPKDIMTTAGAVASSIDLINERFPKAQIIYCSPAYCELLYGDEFVGADIADYGCGPLPTTVEPVYSLAIENLSVSYIDIYIGSGIHSDTVEEYLTEDHVIPNDAGKQRIADRIVRLTKFIASPEPESE